MFSPPELPHDTRIFLRNLEYELRSGAPMDPDTLEIRLAEYLYADTPQAVEAELRAAAAAHLQQQIAQQQAQEATWEGPTDVDRLMWALAQLADTGILIGGHPAKTIEDGWAYLGIGWQGQRGGAFFHQQDVFDAMHGRDLFVAFGAIGDKASDLAIGKDVASTLAMHGLDVAWTGQPEDRIAVRAPQWRARRYTPAPTVGPAARDWQRQPLRLPVKVAEERIADFRQDVSATYDTGAYDSWLFEVMRGAGATIGLQHPQLHHVGLPHAFLPAGEVATFEPCEGSKNLPRALREPLFDRGRRAHQP